jgi:5-methylcytosine-specific restriction endonuclease McrA
MIVERVAVKPKHTNQAARKPRVYDTQRWRKLRLHVLRRDPICVACDANGILSEAKEVDHIKPLSEGGNAFDTSNLQGLCKSCHSAKTMRESKMSIRGGGGKIIEKVR